MRQRSLIALIFLVSFSLINFEISLTRMFSLILSYHYVFLVVSVGILGLGLGSIWGTRLVGHTDERKCFGGLLTVLAVSLPVSSAVLLSYPFAPNLIVFSMIAMVPFIVGGALLSFVFASGRKNGWVHQLYFADLVGAGIGSLLVIPLLSYRGPFAATVYLGTVLLIAALSVARQGKLNLTDVSMLIVLVVISLGVTLYPETEIKLLSMTSSTKSMFNFINSVEDDSEIVLTDWSIMARTDVVQTNFKERKAVFTDGAAPSAMYQFNGDLDEVSFLKQQIGFIPFTGDARKNVLTIGPGAGKDVLLALLGESEKITAVEVNAGIVKAVRQYADYNGNLYDLPQVDVVVDDGRSFVRRSEEMYDLIYLSLVVTDTIDPISFSLIESYIYTSEAFVDYLDKLTDDGQLAMIFHDQNDLLRGLATTLTVLSEKMEIPVSEATNYVAMVNGDTGGKNTIHQPLLLVQKQPFDVHTARDLQGQVERMGLQPLFIPFVFEEGVTAAVGNADLTIEQFVEIAPHNIAPVSDNKPFFYNFNKGVPSYLIKILMIILVLKSMFVVYSVREWSGRGYAKLSLFPFYSYFTLLGIGFMLVEIPLILKFGFFLGRPTVAVSLTIFTILTAGGLGSIIGSRLLPDAPVRATKALSLIVVLLLAYILLLPIPLRYFLLQPFYVRVVLTVLLLAPIGFLLGIPFPSGLSMIKANQPRRVSLLWGVNGLTSVLGSVSAMVMSLLFGFQLTLGLGALCYLAALLFALNMRRIIAG